MSRSASSIRLSEPPDRGSTGHSPAREIVKLGVLHEPTLPSVGCGSLLYNSSSLRTKGTLYRMDASLRIDSIVPLKKPNRGRGAWGRNS